MARFSMNRWINASPGVVFDVFTDLDRAAERIGGITRLEKLTEGPVRVGTRFRETRVVFKREATEEMEFTAVEPGRGFTVECESCGAHYTSTYRFEPDGEGTMVDLTFDVRALSLFAKLLSPLGKLLTGPMLIKCFDKDLQDLKLVAESQPAPA